MNRFHIDVEDAYIALTGETARVPGDRYVPDPGRSITITPEILAEEAAKQSEREAARQHITWQRPEPIAEPAYVRPVRKAHHVPKAVQPRRKVAPLPAPTSAKQKPAPARRKRKMPQPNTFRIGPPVPIDNLPAKWSLSGRTSPYLGLYESITKLEQGSALSVEVERTEAGYAITQALRKMATKDNMKLDMRRSTDGKTFYFAVEKKDEAQPEA